jgi:hypothetical protein
MEVNLILDTIARPSQGFENAFKTDEVASLGLKMVPSYLVQIPQHL